jgi:hypothetical protein
VITSFEVGAVFKIINEASPALARILKQVRDLNLAIDKAKEGLASIGKMPSMVAAIGETDKLAAAWGDVAANAGAARLAMNNAANQTRRAIGNAGAVGGGSAAAGGAGRGGGGGGRRHRSGWLGGGNAHIRGPGIALAGGGHLSLGGPGMAAVAAFGWGIDQAAKTQDYVWRLEDTAGMPHDEATHAIFRKLLENFQIKAGYGIDEAGKAALSDIRGFQATPDGGASTLGEILSAASVEARRKGTSLEESVEAGVGLAHQFRAYTPDAIKMLMRTFAALSTADPRSLTSMKRAAGYSVPALAQLGYDESSVLIAGTALAGAGIDSTKSGTWVREAAVRALPGVVIGHKALNKKHDEGLRRFGLVENGKPTWFTDGHPDLMKLFTTTSDAMQGMSPQDRAGYGRAAFGAQGFGAVAVLGDPAVNARMHAIDATTKSQAYLDRYNSFGKDYSEGSTVQGFREAMATFNVTLGEIARGTLPQVNRELGDFKSIMDGIRSIIPHAADPSTGDKGSTDLMGHAVTGVFDMAKRYMDGLHADKAQRDAERSKGNLDALKGSPGGSGGVFPGGTSRVAPQTIELNLNIDGRRIADALGRVGDATFSGQAPAFDGLKSFSNGDSQHSDK